MRTWLLPARSLWERELILMVRQKGRLLGVLGPPLLFWVLLGSGIGELRGRNYLNYFFPGSLMLIVLFSSIYSMISLIEDRREGFLQAVLASPACRSAVVLGKVFGAASVALIQSALALMLAPFAGISLGFFQALAALGVLSAIAFIWSCVGLAAAWVLDSTQGFHGVMNLLLFPLWLLSGAVFPPPEGSFLLWFFKINPLAYQLNLLQRSLGMEAAAGAGISMAVTGLFAAGMFEIARRLLKNQV